MRCEKYDEGCIVVEAIAFIEPKNVVKDPELAKNQSCGCIVCMCEDEDQCQGCGAKNCGTHPVGEIPNPVYQEGNPSGKGCGAAWE